MLMKTGETPHPPCNHTGKYEVKPTAYSIVATVLEKAVVSLLQHGDVQRAILVPDQL